MTDKKKLPYYFYYIPVLLFSLSGIANSIYLSISHYKNYTDISYISFCAISNSINCDTVSQSKFSVFLNIPVPLWGIIGYLLLTYFVVMAGLSSSEKKRGWSVILALASIFSIISLILAFVSGYFIKSYCAMCILSYGINLLILFYSWIIRNRFENDGLTLSFKKDVAFFLKKKTAWGVVFVVIISPILLWLLLPAYWHLKPLSVDTSGLDTGITEDMHPWIGAADPVLTITEFSDYRCFQCKKAHFFIRKLIASHPDKLRLIHRQYPMDSQFNPVIVPIPFHEGSGKLSLVAIYAALKDEFWPVNDFLFDLDIDANSGINTSDISRLTGLSKVDLYTALNHEGVRALLGNDIRAGMKYEIDATPAYVIEGKVYIGYFPVDVINNALNK